jgi:protein disulfide-isomerase
MKRYLVCFLMVLGIQLFAENLAVQPHISWYTNYNDALKVSQASSKPMVLFFTGSDWCSWCTKLEKEALETSDFINAVGDKLIFVKLDYPRKGNPDPALKAQNEELQKKFSIRGYPTLIVISPIEQQIGITGYRPGGGQDYADHLKKMVDDFSDYKQKMGQIDKPNANGKDLKRVYQKSQELGLAADSQKIIERGIHSDLPHFFLAERYRGLVQKGKSQEPSTAILKKQLLESDPNNLHLIQYQVAVIDYEENCAKMCQGECTPERCVTPLVTYLKTFGSKDKLNEWRLNMIVSQTFLDQKRPEEALQFAQAALKTAPQAVQTEIATGIVHIQAQLEANRHKN